MAENKKIQPKVRIFTTPTCPYCFTLKEFFKDNNIEFEELDVASDKVAREEMIKISGKMEAPVLDIGGEVILGFDREKITKLLNIRT